MSNQHAAIEDIVTEAEDYADGDETADTAGERELNRYGYPDATPLAEMSIEQQAAYWKHKARVHEQRSKSKQPGYTPEEVQALREELEALRNAQLSDSERAHADAVETARLAGRDEARAQLMPLVQEAQLRGYASTVIKGARLDGWVATVNVAAFCAEDGSVDGAKVVEHLRAQYGEEPATPSTYPNFGQGSSGAHPEKSTKSDGLAEARRRFAKAA